MLAGYAQAALGLLPLPGGSSTLPERTLALEGYQVDPANLAAYAGVCGLRLTNTLPLTYGFVLTFPMVMKLLVARDFPLPAMGMVHVQNRIEQSRPATVDEPLDITVRAENLRPHDKGTQLDFISEIKVGRELVWRQVSTFLKIGGGTGAKDKKAPEELTLGAPATVLKADQKLISRYAAVSGDRNPIHVSSLGAKAFGFPRTIAHGMWSAAAALAIVEGRIPDNVVYDVRFGKPVILPAKVNEYAEQRADGTWELALRHPKKLYPHLTATLG
ncbi:MaoC/PaaZ C-terminal domain-containing protein [Tomitella biformata]|uniref:MaoC/PaaZ C-terminal domain-containing protein n=1 Tax=Tomitella biformata TaxID=630403 RepID=UPI0011DD35CD|nr:MaoC/PaaZ C-terminal domain-containing protein [Tomitella biformata]